MILLINIAHVFRKERAKVEFVFDKNSCSTWVSLDEVKHLQKTEGEQ